MDVFSCCTVTGAVTTPTDVITMMPNRQVLDWRHIGKINRLTFKFRELAAETVTLIGHIPVAVMPMVQALDGRLRDSIRGLEIDLITNERSPFEAKLEFYNQELLDLQGAFDELLDLIDTMEY